MSGFELVAARLAALEARVRAMISQGADPAKMSIEELGASARIDGRWYVGNARPELHKRQAEQRVQRLEREQAEGLRRLQFEQAEERRLRAEKEAEDAALWAETRKTFGNLDDAGIRAYARQLAPRDAGRWGREVGERLIQERAQERNEAERARIEARVRNNVEAAHPPTSSEGMVNPGGGRKGPIQRPQ